MAGNGHCPWNTNLTPLTTLTLKRRDERARPLLAGPAFPRQPPQRHPRRFKLRDLRIQCRQPLRRQFPRPRPVPPRIQLQQFPDLLQREARRLRPANEFQPPHVLRAVSPHAAIPLRRPQQTTPLIEAHRLHADAAFLRQTGNRRHALDSVPWYGTYMGSIRITRKKRMLMTSAPQKK